MYFESKIAEVLNFCLSRIREKTALLREHSYIIEHIDILLGISIGLSIFVSLFAGNSITAVFIFGVIVLWLLTLLLKQGCEIRVEKSTFFYLMFFIMTVVSTVNSTLFMNSAAGLSKTVLYLLYFFAVLRFIRDNKDKIPIIAGVIATGVCIESIIAVVQNNMGVLSGATWQDTTKLNPELILTRVFGTLKPYNPNLLGGFLISGIPFLWMISAKFFIDGKVKLGYTGIIFSFLSIAAVFMTGSRGAYLALCVIGVFGLFFAYKILKHHYAKVYELINRHKKSIIIWFCCICAGLLAMLPKITARFLSIFAMRSDSSTSFRMNVYNSAIEMFQDNFWFGIGVGNKTFREIYGYYMLSGYDALSAYCIFLEIGVESGIFALIFYLLFLWFLYKNARYAFAKTNDISVRLYVGAGFLTIAGVLTHGLFDTIYFRPQVQLIFWAAVAITTVCSDIFGEHTHKSKPKGRHNK